MDSLLSCATGRYRPAEKRSPSRTPETTKRQPLLPQQLGEICITGWFLKSPKEEVHRRGSSRNRGPWLTELLFRQRRLGCWRRRFFVLTLQRSQTDCYQLYYYTDANREVPRGAIDLSTVRSIGILIPPPVRLASTMAPELRAGLQLQKPFVSFECRKVASTDSQEKAGERRRFFYLLADSREEMTRWAQQLEFAATASQPSASSTGVSDVLDGLPGAAAEVASAASRPDSGWFDGGCGGGGSSGGFGGSRDSIRTGGTPTGKDDEQRSIIIQPPQHLKLAAPKYATLDVSAIRQPRTAAPPAAKPTATRSGDLDYREVDLGRTRALAEIGADFAKRSHTH